MRVSLVARQARPGAVLVSLALSASACQTGGGPPVTLSDLSVRRPVFAAVAAIILVVVGLASFFALSVRELPSVDPPQV